MSWGYWGIVMGLMGLVATLLISMDILYRPPKSPRAEGGKKMRPERGVGGSTHKQKDVA